MHTPPTSNPPDSPWLSYDNGTDRLSYFKRFRMEVELDRLPDPVRLPGYTWEPFRPALLDLHADALFHSFEGEVDAAVFPSLASASGCYCLMSEIVRRTGFLPEATWLLRCGDEPCGTVQGVRERGTGAIQNLGIVPAHRGRGLGEALLLHALAAFRRLGLGRGLLEVTAQNESACRLYRRLGFRRRKTLYKPVLPRGVVPILFDHSS
jgi:ribosomal protein S18 acetylase RimI-like enzyme